MKISILRNEATHLIFLGTKFYILRYKFDQNYTQFRPIMRVIQNYVFFPVDIIITYTYNGMYGTYCMHYASQ